MSEPAKKKSATYEDLFSIPENATGEIIEGELIVTPRPSRKHTFASSALDKEIGPPYQFGRGGGPGGWIIIVEPEISLGDDIVVPDLAGWEKGRFPYSEETNWISVPPDWVCEVLSPSTFRTDRTKKMAAYARHGVGHIWLIDPVAEMVEVFRLESGRWALLGVFVENDRMKAEPFGEIAIDLNNLWLRP
jgi:Uma2 family endonuclease